jgi:hypothetical protein
VLDNIVKYIQYKNICNKDNRSQKSFSLSQRNLFSLVLGVSLGEVLISDYISFSYESRIGIILFSCLIYTIVQCIRLYFNRGLADPFYQMVNSMPYSNKEKNIGDWIVVLKDICSSLYITILPSLVLSFIKYKNIDKTLIIFLFLGIGISYALATLLILLVKGISKLVKVSMYLMSSFLIIGLCIFLLIATYYLQIIDLTEALLFIKTNYILLSLTGVFLVLCVLLLCSLIKSSLSNVSQLNYKDIQKNSNKNLLNRIVSRDEVLERRSISIVKFIASIIFSSSFAFSFVQYITEYQVFPVAVILLLSSVQLPSIYFSYFYSQHPKAFDYYCRLEPNLSQKSKNNVILKLFIPGLIILIILTIISSFLYDINIWLLFLLSCELLLSSLLFNKYLSRKHNLFSFNNNETFKEENKSLYISIVILFVIFLSLILTSWSTITLIIEVCFFLIASVFIWCLNHFSNSEKILKS